MKVFVVVAHAGQYADQETWVSGVFLSREDADAAVERGVDRRNKYAEWRARYHSEFNRLPEWRIPFSEMKAGQQEAATAKAESLAGPKPEVELAEEFEIEEMVVGEWRGSALVD